MYRNVLNRARLIAPMKMVCHSPTFRLLVLRVATVPAFSLDRCVFSSQTAKGEYRYYHRYELQSAWTEWAKRLTEVGCCCRDRHKRKQVRSIRGSRFAVFAEGWRHRGPREKKPRQGTRTARPAAGKISSGSGFFACLRPGQPPGATQAGGPGQKRGLGYAMPLSQRAHVRCRLHDRWVDPHHPAHIAIRHSHGTYV